MALVLFMAVWIAKAVAADLEVDERSPLSHEYSGDMPDDVDGLGAWWEIQGGTIQIVGP
jgi:hypothetical protein